jgi:DNA polymerase-3 subunit gamma/tau
MSLHTKYRPHTFAGVVGQRSQIRSIKAVIKEKGAQVFLFTGPSGTGKTTLARICATALDVEPTGITELDAATQNGIDSMRAVIDESSTFSFTENGRRAFIIDECHMLSKAAWNSLLKVLEEPPPHVVFFLCTTEFNKVPATIKTRCVIYQLHSLSNEEIRQVLEPIATAEGMKLAEGVLDLVVDAARGSPRLALTILSKVHECPDVKDASALLAREQPSAEAIDVARALFKQGTNYVDLIKLLAAMKDENPESIRITVFAYGQAVLLGAKTDREVERILRALGALETPCDDLNRIGGIALKLCRALAGLNK